MNTLRFVAFAIVLPFVASCGQRDSTPSNTKSERADAIPVVVRLADTQFMGILPLYVADEKGFFKSEGVRLEWLDVKDPSQAAKIFFAGQADLLMTTFANMLPAEIREPGTLKLLLPACETGARPGSFFLAKKESPLSSSADLKGHTLGTYSGASQKVYTLAILTRLGLREPEDVKLQQVQTSAQVQALFGGAFDVLFAVEPYASMAMAQGAKVIESGVRMKHLQDPFWIGSVALTTQFLKKNPEAKRRLTAALEKAVHFIEGHESEAREILGRRTNLEPEIAAKCVLYQWIPHPSPDQLRHIQEHADFLHRETLLDNPLSTTPLFHE